VQRRRHAKVAPSAWTGSRADPRCQRAGHTVHQDVAGAPDAEVARYVPSAVASYVGSAIASYFRSALAMAASDSLMVGALPPSTSRRRTRWNPVRISFALANSATRWANGSRRSPGMA
jgi:hypothetical protein